MASYGSIIDADVYFDDKLVVEAWQLATVKQRTNALQEATYLIDKLNFAGDKNDSSQELQFPRNDDTDVPVEIEYATYEIAYKFLDGWNPDRAARRLGVVGQMYSGIRTTYGEDFVEEHVRAGIPSIIAWEYLKPFLRDERLMRLSRVT